MVPWEEEGAWEGGGRETRVSGGRKGSRRQSKRGKGVVSSRDACWADQSGGHLKSFEGTYPESENSEGGAEAAKAGADGNAFDAVREIGYGEIVQ
jgi:hypothetical protein